MKCTSTPSGQSHVDYSKTREYAILAKAMLKAGMCSMDVRVILRAAFDAGWYRSEERFEVNAPGKLN